MLTGKQLRLLRQARGLMQKELADRMEIAQQRLSALEKTKRKITEQSAIKALTALSFSNEEAFLFLNTLPQSASGGGVSCSMALNYQMAFKIRKYFAAEQQHVQNTGYNFLFIDTDFSACTTYPCSNY